MFDQHYYSDLDKNNLSKTYFIFQKATFIKIIRDSRDIGVYSLFSVVDPIRFMRKIGFNTICRIQGGLNYMCFNSKAERLAPFSQQTRILGNVVTFNLCLS
jgi:hypothetical protein